MPDYSAHYNLIMLGAGDSLAEDDHAFTKRNIQNLDNKAYIGAEAHHHTGDGVPQADPTLPLALTLVTGSGVLPGNRTIRYKFTWVDQYGQETGASPEATINTPVQVSPPNNATLQKVAGGTLLYGNYFYLLTAYKGATTLETTVGENVFTTLNFNGSYQSVRLVLPSLPSGADGFNIYRRKPGSNKYLFLDSVDMSGATPPDDYLDDGSTEDDCNRTVPRRNTTATNNAIEIAVPGATPSVPFGYTWKVYRTYVNNDWDSSELVWVVEETSLGSGETLPTYTDTGTSTTEGTYPPQTELSGSPEQIQMTDVEEVQGYLPPGRNIMPIVLPFTQSGQVTVQTGVFQWPCDYEQVQIISARASLGPDYSPSADPVIVDIEKFDAHAATPTWSSIFADTARRPEIPVGESIGTKSTLLDADTQILLEDDAIRVNVIQEGGGATPNDYNLIVTIKVYVKDGDEDVSHVWAVEP